MQMGGGGAAIEDGIGGAGGGAGEFGGGAGFDLAGQPSEFDGLGGEVKPGAVGGIAKVVEALNAGGGQVGQAAGQFRGVGGAAALVVDHAEGGFLPGEAQDGTDEILAMLAIKP